MRWNSMGTVVAVLGWVVACAAAKAPASGPGPAATGALAASAALAPTDVHAELADAGAGIADAAAAAVTVVARDASSDDEEGDAGVKLVFDPGAARAGGSKVAALVNVEAFRANRSGRQLGPVVKTITEEAHFTHAEDLGVNWLLYTSPSLMKKELGTLTMYCSAPDAKIDKWMKSKRDPSGKAVDLGPGVHAERLRLEGVELVLMRPQSHVVVLVAAPLATEAARLAQAAHLPAHADQGEALRFRAKNLSRVISELPSSITEARFWIAPRKDQGADFTFEADTAGAAMVAQQLHDFLDKEVDVAARTALLGLLDHPDITANGDVASVHVRATDAQLAGIVQLILMEAR